MTAADILAAMAKDDNLADEVLFYLNYGVQAEWDCTLPQALTEGFGGEEYRIAAKTGYALFAHNQGELTP